MNILQKIFSENFHSLTNSSITIRDTVIENVDKMIHCGDFKRGYVLYACDNCGHMMVTPFRCRSRFCTSCGNLYSRKRSTAMSFKLVRTSHRHCVFTIPEELRGFFRKDRSLLNYLFKAAVDSVFFMFKKIKAYIYKNCPNGFYVYAKPTLTNNQDVLKYIGRYLGRPVIATSRIDNYDGKNITFHYNRHEDNELVSETVYAIDFIKKLIIHIPEKHFKMIRYYGIYAKHHHHEGKLSLFIPKEKRRFHICQNAWRTSISLSFHFNPLLCK